jgi:hypothetical protein
MHVFVFENERYNPNRWFELNWLRSHLNDFLFPLQGTLGEKLYISLFIQDYPWASSNNTESPHFKYLYLSMNIYVRPSPQSKALKLTIPTINICIYPLLSMSALGLDLNQGN